MSPSHSIIRLPSGLFFGKLLTRTSTFAFWYAVDCCIKSQRVRSSHDEMAQRCPTDTFHIPTTGVRRTSKRGRILDSKTTLSSSLIEQWQKCGLRLSWRKRIMWQGRRRISRRRRSRRSKLLRVRHSKLLIVKGRRWSLRHVLLLWLDPQLFKAER